MTVPTGLLSLIVANPGISGRSIAERHYREYREPRTSVGTQVLKRRGLIYGVRDKKSRRTLWYPTEKGARMFGGKRNTLRLSRG